MGKSTSVAVRLAILQRCAAGLSDAEVAAELGYSAVTVRKWRRRGASGGRAGMASVMGRPPQGALSSYPEWLRATLRQWRAAHPRWGPKTLRAELGRDRRCQGQPLPARSTLGRWLREEGLTRPYQKHAELPATPRCTPQAAHEEWEMDARGQERVAGVGVVALIDLNDRYSRTRLLSYPCWLGSERAERHPQWGDYQLTLRLAFTDWGLPDRLAVDHDSVFYDNETASPFPTRLHLWLLALGVELAFNRRGRPTDQAITERSHQLWFAQVVAGAEYPSWAALFQALQARREFLNWHLPCASLGERPPLAAHPEATRPRRGYRPEWERELLDLGRIDAYLAQCHWFRRVSKDGTVRLGGVVYYAGTRWAGREVELRFDPPERQLVFHSEDGTEFRRQPLREVTQEALLGDLWALYQTPGYQLRLPFTPEAERAVRLCESLAGTS